jgi:hypothetical protein
MFGAPTGPPAPRLQGVEKYAALAFYYGAIPSIIAFGAYSIPEANGLIDGLYKLIIG